MVGLATPPDPSLVTPDPPQPHSLDHCPCSCSVGVMVDLHLLCEAHPPRAWGEFGVWNLGVTPSLPLRGEFIVFRG